MWYLQDNQFLKIKPNTTGVFLILETYYDAGPIQVQITSKEDLTRENIDSLLNTLRDFWKTVCFGLNYGIGAEKLAGALKSTSKSDHNRHKAIDF